MESDLECSLVHKQYFPDFVSYFPVSVLASMHACAVWFEPSVLGLGSVNADGSLVNLIQKQIKESQHLF